MTTTKNEMALVDIVEKGSNKMSGGYGIRHLQVLLLFLGMVIGYCLRVSMSEAIVAMTSNESSEVYNWTLQEKSMILSSFFWGYTAMQIPSGYIAGAWSAQKLLSYGMLLCGVFNILTPIAARYADWVGVCVCRIVMGLCQSCLLPSIHTLLSKWAPPSERARLGTFAYAGAQFGTVISFPISGVLAVSSTGWASIFYVFGSLAILWSISFLIVGFDSPAVHPRISEREKQYIEDSLKTAEEQETSVNKPNGLISALPYLAMWILSFPTSWLSDYALEKGVSRGVARKVCNTIAHWGPGIALICLAVIPKHTQFVAVAILVVAVALNAGSLCGFQINHIDLSPNFAGTMMSITNCIASVIAIIAPLICGKIVTDEANVTQWGIVFYLAAGIYFIGNLVFIVFGEAEIQPWDEPEITDNVKPTKKESIIA
ncbi:putative inorganic phosphate cotransporter isoform X2 [Andrena cerasifolii]|uniref:putative inorganic phosphate cotransporter isoform X2 n=1 Tax=Andrena cerasifolii TaxID=2819439 RepID=UPI004037E994